MKLLFAVLVALSISILGFGCLSTDGRKNQGEGSTTTTTTTNINEFRQPFNAGEQMQLFEKTMQSLKNQMEQEYHVAQEFDASVTVNGETEELWVVIQSHKTKDESIVLVAETSHSKKTTRDFLERVKKNNSSLHKEFCCEPGTFIEYTTLSASVAVVGRDVKVLTGGIKCYVDICSIPGVMCNTIVGGNSCGSKVQGMRVKGVSKNKEGVISAVTLGTAGVEDVVAQLSLNSGKNSRLSLALYRSFLSNINDFSFCPSHFTKEALIIELKKDCFNYAFEE